jgi:hypothetical protein
MSQIHDARYRLEREERQRINEERVRQTTSSFIERYHNELAGIQQQGLAEYVQERYDSCVYQLRQIEAELASSPFSARERSKSLGNEIYALRNVARRIKVQVEEAQYQQHRDDLEARVNVEKERKAQISNAWSDELRNWTDKLSLNLMLKEVKELEQQVFSEQSSGKAQDLLAYFQQLKKKGLEKAANHRALIEKQTQHTTNRDVAQTLVEIVSLSLPVEESKKLTEQADIILSAISQDANEQLKEIDQLSDLADEIIENEAVRKETVKAIYNTLKITGFTVQKPKVVETKEGVREVIIAASRPAGNRAKFKIRLDGSCTYEFDNYKGQTCKKDIEQVLPKLNEVYGVDLSDSRVVWSNPDDEDAQMKPIPSQTMNSKG